MKLEPEWRRRAKAAKEQIEEQQSGSKDMTLRTHIEGHAPQPKEKPHVRK